MTPHACAPGLTDRWEAEAIHQSGPGQEAAYLMLMAGSRSAPAYLSCSDDTLRAETRYEALSFTRLP